MLPRRALLLVACIGVACWLTSTPCVGRAIAPPLVAPSATPPFTPAPMIPPERTAYVAIHFEDTETNQRSQHDTETSLVGIRTMMHTVRDPARGASTRDRVVLVPSHTPAAVRETFESDGLIVMEMDDTLPHRDICAPKFDRIFLWSAALAAKYDRIIYLDWDVLVQRPMDSLFLCGHFCMVFNSILHFTDGLMVVKPDPQVFARMVAKYKHERPLWKSGMRGDQMRLLEQQDVTPEQMRAWPQPSKTFCWERSYLFFLEFFGNIEASTLFNPAHGQSPLPLQRLQSSAQLNAMMWYEKYSWVLMRSKEYRNMSDPQAIPALSLGFTTLKPFHWAPGLFFDLSWMWSDVRDEYLGTSHSWFVVSRLALIAAFLVFTVKGLARCMVALYRRRSVSGSIFNRGLAMLRDLHMLLLGPTDGYLRVQNGSTEELVYQKPSIFSVTGYWLPLLGSDLLGVIFGTLQCLTLVYILTGCTVLIPLLTAPHPAWRLWCIMHTVATYAWDYYLWLAYHACPPLISPAAGAESLNSPTASPGGVAGATGRLSPTQSSSGVSASSLSFPFMSRVTWLAFWEAALYFFMRRTFYPEFIVKMFVMFPLLAAVLISGINLNRAVWKSIEHAKANAAAGKETVLQSAPSTLPLLPTSATARTRD